MQRFLLLILGFPGRHEVEISMFGRDIMEIRLWILCCLLIVPATFAGNHDDECDTVTEIVQEDNCPRGCLIRDDDGCPACNNTCQELRNPEDLDLCRSDLECDDNQVCLAVGIAGQHTCIDRLRNNDACDGENNNGEDDFDDEDYMDSLVYRRALERAVGASDRLVVGLVGDADVPCEEGMVCRRVSLDRRECRDVAGPCVDVRNTTDPGAQCDTDGGFEATQCRRQQSGSSFRCYCVQPGGDGAPIPGTVVFVNDTDNTLDCDDLVYERCEYDIAGLEFSVRHGDTFVDLETCSRCVCNDGTPTFCVPLGDCQLLKPGTNPDQCTMNGFGPIPHGATLMLDCNTCGCRDGRLRCTDLDCDEDDPEDDVACDSCDLLPRTLVCGRDGRTYPSSCFAVNCSGLQEDELRPGPCSSYDVCQLYPCDPGETCIRQGGVACLYRRGCEPDELRVCVNLAQLRCNDLDIERNDTNMDEEDERADDDTTVCGTNGRSYRSLCLLLQDTGNVKVAYAGRCNRTECTGGLVCGSDGVTYNSTCELRSQSANARVDYKGPCFRPTSPETSEENYCTPVRAVAGMCHFNSTNCDYRVQPLDGCCPICGGVVAIALDRDGLDEYVRLNPSLRTLDDFSAAVLASGFIPANLTARCFLEFTPTNRGIELVLTPREPDFDTDPFPVEISIGIGARSKRAIWEINPEDALFCNEQASSLAMMINCPQTHPPQVLRQFASAAAAAPLIVESSSTPPSGALPLAGVSCLAMVLLATLLALLVL